MTVRNKCPMITLILLNLMVFIAGGAMLIAGFILKFDSGLLEAEVIELFNRVIVSNIPLGTLADANAYMMIISGGIIMFIAILGLCGAWKNIKGCLWAFIVVVIVLMMVQALEAGMWIFLRQKSDEWFKGQMLTLFESYEGPEATDEISKGWNKLFIASKCCGVNSQYANGGTNNDFSEIPAPWWANRAADFVPASCCQGVTTYTVANYIASAGCTIPDPPKNFYSTGCYTTVMTTINTYSLILLICAGGLFFVQVAAIVCACILIQRKNKVAPRSRDRVFDSYDRSRYPYFEKPRVTDGGRHKPIQSIPPPPPPRY